MNIDKLIDLLKRTYALISELEPVQFSDNDEHTTQTCEAIRSEIGGTIVQLGGSLD